MSRKRTGLSFRQRREMGLTFRNVRKVLKDLRETDSEEFETLSHEELAVIVTDTLVVENSSAFHNAALDWDAILDFLTRLISLILKFFG